MRFFSCSYLVDDEDAVKEFIERLTPDEKRLRFGGNKTSDEILRKWRPQHIVLAVRDGKACAAADCIISEDKKVAVGGVVAINNHGLDALAAWMHMRNKFSLKHIQVTLPSPTRQLIELARYGADSIYDSGAWDISQELWRTIGPHTQFSPTPMALTNSNYREFRLPFMKSVDPITRSQIALAFLFSNDYTLISKKYGIIPKPLIATLNFELQNTPLIGRQRITRSLLLSAALHFRKDKIKEMKRKYLKDVEANYLDDFAQIIRKSVLDDHVIHGRHFDLIKGQAMPRIKFE
jgi:hypothetical protein